MTYRLFFFVILLAPALAIGSDHDYDDDRDELEILTNTETNVSDRTRLLSLGQALGGVEIAGCVVTTQFGIIIYQHQGYKYDVFCLARELDQIGKYEDAAEMRCLQKIPRKLYGARCLEVMNYEPPETDNPGPENAEQMTIFESRIQAQEDEQQVSIDRFDAIEQRLDREAAARRAYAAQAAAEKKIEEQRASDAFSAYKAVQQMEIPQQQEDPPNE